MEKRSYRKSVGQITVKKIGKKYGTCIGGTPVRLYDSKDAAVSKAYQLRKKYGRRNYQKK